MFGLEKINCQLCGGKFRKRHEDKTYHGLCPTCVERVKTELMKLYEAGGKDDKEFRLPSDSDGPARLQLIRLKMLEPPKEQSAITPDGIKMAIRVDALMPAPEVIARYAHCDCELHNDDAGAFAHKEGCAMRKEWIEHLHGIAETVGLTDALDDKTPEQYAQMVMFLWCAFKSVEAKAE